jgi:hypothetical protein
MLPLSLVFVLFLSCPSFTRAGDSYNDDLRMLDLELEMLSVKSQMLSQERAAIGARLHEATSERGQFYKDAERDISESYRQYPQCSNWITSPSSTPSHSSPPCVRPGCSRLTGGPDARGTAGADVVCGP